MEDVGGHVQSPILIGKGKMSMEDYGIYAIINSTNHSFRFYVVLKVIQTRQTSFYFVVITKLVKLGISVLTAIIS